MPAVRFFERAVCEVQSKSYVTEQFNTLQKATYRRILEDILSSNEFSPLLIILSY
jgi:hypothetical protein